MRLDIPSCPSGPTIDLDLTCASSLLVLLDEGHFGRAASRLHVTPSALTKRIQRLERQVGAVLLIRATEDGPVPTAAGLAFAVEARALLAAAAAARRAAVNAQEQSLGAAVILGIPAGPVDFLAQLDLSTVAARVRDNYGGVRVATRMVPFTLVTSWLVQGEIDILLTVAPVRHVAVESVALPVRMRRIGLVARDHELADCSVVDVEDFVARPMLCSPAIPAEWMEPFFLGDVRPRADARLVEISPQNASGVTREIRDDCVAVGPEMFSSVLTTCHSVTLRGAPEMILYAAHRRTEQRGAIHTFVEALRQAPGRRLSPRN